MTAKTKTFAVLTAVVLALAILVAWRVADNARAARARPDLRPLSVDVAAARIAPMPVLIEAVGQVQPEHSVQIRPQVPGVLQRVFFTEGQYVRAGARLFQIDPAPFEAALRAAQAAYDYAKANVEREAPLAAKDYVTPQEYQNTVTAERQAQAALQQARINLSYTTIRAPISGRTGSLAIKAGNVVSPSDAAPLVTINQMKPILVQFAVPQQFLPQVRRYYAGRGIRVFVSREDGSGELDRGRLVFIDNAVNAQTGTVMLKAQMPNRHEQLWPGQYVGVKMQLTVQPDALVIPLTAVQSGQNGNFVYRVRNGRVTVAPIAVDRSVGDWAVVAHGLKPGDEVVVRVPRNLRAGAAVRVTASPAPAAASQTPAP